MRVIYVDTLFFLNMAVNYLLLLGTGHFSGLPFKRRRLFLSSLLGAAYAVLACMNGFEMLNSVFFKAVSGAVMVFAGFGCDSLKNFGKRLVLFFLVSAVFGGGVFAAYIAGGGTPSGFGEGMLYTRISLKVLIISVAACYGLVSIFFGGAGRHGAFGRETAEVRVRSGGREAVFSALVDSGNTLRDPVTGTPVLIAEPEAVRPVLPPAIRGLFDRSSVKSPSELMEVLSGTEYAVRFRLIPFRAVGTESGLLIAFRPDRIEIAGKPAKGMLIAFSPNELSEGAGYCALVGAVK